MKDQKKENRVILLLLCFEREGTIKEKGYAECGRQRGESERHSKSTELGYTEMKDISTHLCDEKSRTHPHHSFAPPPPPYARMSTIKCMSDLIRTKEIAGTARP